MMHILIIEDEPDAAEHLIRLINRLDEEVRIVANLSSVAEAVSWLRASPSPDLIFLDIQLSDGISFSIFDQTEVESPVIFTTAYDQYALNAFKVNSIDYLLKPIDLNDLQRAVDKWKHLLSGVHRPHYLSKHDVEMILKSMKPKFKERFMVRIGNHLRSIPVSEAAMFKSWEKIIYLILFDGKRYAVDFTLNELEDMLNPARFFRVNRQYILNLGSIQDVVSYSNSRLKIVTKLLQESGIIVSRDRVNDFRDWLGQ
jgi:DNA-binding LytR/AlgR family response regulator